MRKLSQCEQGSSWAVEVGNDHKVCPIIVENINMNGQMLVEVMPMLANFQRVSDKQEWKLYFF